MDFVLCLCFHVDVFMSHVPLFRYIFMCFLILFSLYVLNETLGQE